MRGCLGKFKRSNKKGIPFKNDPLQQSTIQFFVLFCLFRQNRFSMPVANTKWHTNTEQKS